MVSFAREQLCFFVRHVRRAQKGGMGEVLTMKRGIKVKDRRRADAG